MLPTQTKPEIETTTHNIQTKNCNISLEITFVNAREGRNFQPKRNGPAIHPGARNFNGSKKRSVHTTRSTTYTQTNTIEKVLLKSDLALTIND